MSALQLYIHSLLICLMKNCFFHPKDGNFYMDTWFFCSSFCCARNSSLSFSTRSCLAILSIRWWFWTVSTYSKGDKQYMLLSGLRKEWIQHVIQISTSHFILVNSASWRWQRSCRHQALTRFGLLPREIPFPSVLFESIFRRTPVPGLVFICIPKSLHILGTWSQSHSANSCSYPFLQTFDSFNELILLFLHGADILQSREHCEEMCAWSVGFRQVLR